MSADFTALITGLHDPGAGMLRVHLARAPDGVRATYNAAERGEVWIGFIGLICQTATAIETAAANQPLRCLCCASVIGNVRGTVFGAIVEDVIEPEHGLGLTICEACGDQPGLENRAVAALRAALPGLRRLVVHPSGGHA